MSFCGFVWWRVYLFYRIINNKQTNLKTFEELGVSEEIRRAISELGFEHPMPVQEEVIPYLLGNRNDVIALAQTGQKTQETLEFLYSIC